MTYQDIIRMMFFFVFNKNIFNYILIKIYTKYIFIIGEYKQYISI